MKWKIGVITHYKDTNRFNQLKTNGTGDCELHFEWGVLGHAIKVAKRMENQLQYHAILANQGTAKLLAQHIHIPIVPLYIRNDHIFEALFRAKTIGEKISFADPNHEVIYDICRVAQIMDIPIRVYPMHDMNDANLVVESAIRDRMDVLVTPASCVESAAVEQNLQAVLIQLQEQDIFDAVESAVNILKIRTQHEEQIKWLSAAIDNTKEGIIILDRTQVVMLANSVTVSVLSTPAAQLIGSRILDLYNRYSTVKNLVEIDPNSEFQVVSMHGLQYIVTRQSIEANGEDLGSIIRFSEVKQLQETELEIRKTIGTNGFVAKYTFDDIIGSSDALSQIKSEALHFAQTEATVLILGESGCGKEMFAQSVHNASRFSGYPFVAVNCATLPENLLESELFGYADGAFTGSKKGGKPGLFEMAHGGTLFLDEIGDMPLWLQTKLLRVLQEKVIRRIGGDKNIPVQVRLIFATNKDLSKEIRKGNFREDLFYRINVLRLRLPTLRERAEDIPSIVSHFLRNSDMSQIKHIRISPQHFIRMKRYPWPGNVRELQNFVERMTAMSGHLNSDKLLDYLLDDLDEHNKPEAETPISSNTHITVPIGTIRDIERFVIREVLKQCDGKQQDVERILGISSTTLWRRLKEQSTPQVSDERVPLGPS